MSNYYPGATPPPDQPGQSGQPDQPTRRIAPPWWRGRVVVSVLALAIGTILGAAIVVDPDTTAAAGAEPEPAPTVTVTETEAVPQERIDELDDREKSLDARQGRLDDREEGLDERKANLDEREAGLDDRESAVTEAEEEAAANTITGDGLYVIGDDIEPGTYRATGGGDLCYWARLSGLSGELGDIIANDLGAAKTTVEIQASDTAFETRGCGEWMKTN